MKPKLFAALLLNAFVGASVLAIAQQPKVVNTQFHSEPAGAGLSATVDRFLHANGPLWLGYEVPALPRTNISACSSEMQSSPLDDACCGEYQLEGLDDEFRTTDKTTQAPTNMYVLLRLDQGAVTKIRAVIAGCRLNAGGRPFNWLTGVRPEDSAEYLGNLATGNNRLSNEALATLAMHATPKATAGLGLLASPSNPLWLREKAAFWLGAQRGHEGLLALEQLARTDSDPKFREKLTFDLSTNSDPGAVDQLIEIAKTDADSGVRAQALFWLAQKAGARAVAALQNAVENDPEVAVKRKAVFALSRLPEEEAISQLLHVAQTSPDSAIRKEAIFWLGQTHDPRALQYFEQVLQH